MQSPSPRFTDNNDGTVTDNLTGLVWLKNANLFGEGMHEAGLGPPGPGDKPADA